MSKSAVMLTGEAAWSRYEKLINRISLFSDRGDHFNRFTKIAGDVLQTHPLLETNKNSEELSKIDNDQEVLETIQDLLETPSVIFCDEFFEAPFFPVRLLYEVAVFYNAFAIPYEFVSFLKLAPKVSSNKKVQTVTWLYSTMCMSYKDTKSTISRIMSMRSLNAGFCTQQKDNRSQDCSETPAAHFTVSGNQFSGNKSVSIQDEIDDDGSPNIDTSRNRRLENLKQGIRSSSISASERMKQTNYVTAYFANKQFSGDLSQSITLVIQDYKHSATLCNLDESVMATNFTSCLRDPARAFFLSKVYEGQSFNEIEDFMLAEYNSRSRQIQIRKKLESIQLKSIMAERNIQTEQDALNEIIKLINTLVPQCPPAFRSDENKINFLRQAVVCEIWAKSAISEVDAEGVSWFQFTTDLHEAISLHREVEQETAYWTQVSEQLRKEIENTLFTRYGRDPRKTQKFAIRKHDGNYQNGTQHTSKQCRIQL